MARSSRSNPEPRALAAQVLGDVLRRGRTLDQAFESSRSPPAPTPSDASLARLIVLTTLRHLGEIDAIANRLLERPLAPRLAPVADALRIGIAQLVFTEVAAHAAVDRTVAVLAAGRFKAYRGLVNAVLRRAAETGVKVASGLDAPRLNTPDWLWRSWSGAYGASAAREIAAQHLVEPPLDLTVASDGARWARRLDATVLPTGSLRLNAHPPVASLPGYDGGGWWVQDAAAALPARLLGDLRGRRVIEIGAAPGGKTAQLATAGATVTAVDRSARRIARLRENLARLGLKVEVIEADACTWRPTHRVDAVLVDAPCTATGTIRRHPDVARLRSADDVARMATTQDALLDAAIDMLCPGGSLVYATCSLEPAECDLRIEHLLTRWPHVARVPIRADEVGGLPDLVTAAGDLRTLPLHLAAKGGMDGFYAARLRLQS